MLKLKVDFKSSAFSGDSAAAAFRLGRSGVRQLAGAFPATATLPSPSGFAARRGAERL